MTSASAQLLVSLIQADIKWQNKTANLEMFEELIQSNKEKMEVVFLPEMFSTGFVMQPESLAEKMDGPTIDWMRALSALKKIILAGSLIIEDDGQYFNRLIWMLPNGTTGYYDKRHLFAYAGEDEKYSSGNKRLIASVKGWRLNLQICYDLRFPVWARQTVPVQLLSAGQIVRREAELNPEYDVLVYVANWPEKRSHAWNTLLQARAIENQCYVVGVNRVGTDGENIYYKGDSMVVDPLGEIVQTAGKEASIITCELSYEKLSAVRQKLPFLKDADPFIIGYSHP